MSDYDIFEKLPNGSLQWHACVSGECNREHKLQELAKTSSNVFFALDLAKGDVAPPGLDGNVPGPRQRSKDSHKHAA